MGVSCEGTDYPEDEFSVSDVLYGSCKPVMKSDIEEYLLLKVKDNYYLDIEHINAWFNCEPGEIIVDASIEEATITINEYSTENLVNCICPYDLNYLIGPLYYGTYQLNLNKGGLNILSKEISFDAILDREINLGSLAKIMVNAYSDNGEVIIHSGTVKEYK